MAALDTKRKGSSAPLPIDRPVPQHRRPLTGRQGRVLELLALGLETKEIAWSLDISESAVKKNVARLKARYGAPNRTAVVLFAIRLGELAFTPGGLSARRIERSGSALPPIQLLATVRAEDELAPRAFPEQREEDQRGRHEDPRDFRADPPGLIQERSDIDERM